MSQFLYQMQVHMGWVTCFKKNCMLHHCRVEDILVNKKMFLNWYE